MSMLTVRQIEPADKDWLRIESRRQGSSMEELVRRIIHERRMHANEAQTPSDIVRNLFGSEAGVELGERARFGVTPHEFAS